MTAIGPVSMAIYTPAMPEIVRALGTSEAMVKLTLTLYFGGFAAGQLVAGPLSDALGRRAVTFGFMGVYCLASLAGLMAQDVGMLMAARFVQGVGASAGIAISRALVRDLFQGERSARIMNLIGIILAAGPAVAPTVGGLLLVAAGWRSVFVAMVGFGLAVVHRHRHRHARDGDGRRRAPAPAGARGGLRGDPRRPPLPDLRRHRRLRGRRALRPGDLPAVHPDGPGRALAGGLRPRHAVPVGQLPPRLAGDARPARPRRRRPAGGARPRLHRRRQPRAAAPQPPRPEPARSDAAGRASPPSA